ncbi:MAG TPA: TRAP transporter small permease subunit, partial [Geminicoccaceae bacterium]|nr:TRAP transporter small permease subunit [Geminicoccaceae bacterium]
MQQTIARGYAALLAGVRVATAVALVLLVAVVVASVVVRYFGLFGGSLHWTTELSRFIIVWVVMLGSVVAF